MVAYEHPDYLLPDCKTVLPVAIVFHPCGYPPSPTSTTPRPDLAIELPESVRAAVAAVHYRIVCVCDPATFEIVAIHPIVGL